MAIVNPISGRRSAKYLLGRIADLLHLHGAVLEVCTTERKGHGAELASRAAEESDAVLIVGGDGTVREAVQGLVHRDTPFAILGMGTENLIARELGMPINPGVVVERLLRGEARACDVGDANGRRFLAVVGVGFDAECVRRLTALRRGHITHFDYFWPIFRTFWGHRFPDLRIDVDGERVFAGRGMAFVGQIARYSVGLRVCARARHDDGLLDVCVMPCASRTALLAHAWRILWRRHLDRGGTWYRQCRRVQITSPDSPDVELDGDVGPSTPLVCTILPGAVRYLAAPRHDERARESVDAAVR